MKVRVLSAFDIYKRGSEFDWPSPMVKILKARGLVEVLDQEEESPVEAAIAPEEKTERAVITNKPRRRKK
jgi:hypothetical protein